MMRPKESSFLTGNVLYWPTLIIGQRYGKWLGVEGKSYVVSPDAPKMVSIGLVLQDGGGLWSNPGDVLPE
jgi:hypothetical protein